MPPTAPPASAARTRPALGAPVRTATVSRQIELAVTNIGEAIGDYRQGLFRPIGQMGTRRWAVMPDVPTFREQGFPDYEVLEHIALLAPAGTPREIVNKLHGELKAVMAQPDMKAQMAKIGMIAVDSPSPEALQSFIGSEVARWGKIVQQAGIAGSH